VLLGLTVGLNLIILDAAGKPLKIQNFEPSGTFDGRFIDQDRFTPLQGRLNPGEALRSQG
jgi:hypothetical protein